MAEEEKKEEIGEEEKKASLLADDLASLENYIHDLFSFSPLPICFVSPIGVMLEINPAFEKIPGLKSYELIGEPIEVLFEKDKITANIKVIRICPKCSYKEAETWQEQTRSADEPSTTFFRCLKCRFTWREY